MFTQAFTIKNPTGLHARPASQLAALCKAIPDEIRIVTEKGTFNPKGVMAILMAGLKKGTPITLEIEGATERESGEQIISFLNQLSE